MPAIARTTTILACLAGLYYAVLLLMVVPHTIPAERPSPRSPRVDRPPPQSRPAAVGSSGGGGAISDGSNPVVNRAFRSFGRPAPEMLEAARRGRPFSDGRREVAIEEVPNAPRQSRTPDARLPTTSGHLPTEPPPPHLFYNLPTPRGALSAAAASGTGSRDSPRHGSTRRAWTTASWCSGASATGTTVTSSPCCSTMACSPATAKRPGRLS